MPISGVIDMGVNSNNISPSNFVSLMVESNMLQVIVMAVLLGFAIIMRGEKKEERLAGKGIVK